MSYTMFGIQFSAMRKILTCFLFALLAFSSSAQKRDEILAYIEKYKDLAIQEMVRAKVPASITLAQGILETGAGKSELCLNSNNHFGIKCKEEWTGGKYYHDDDRPQECFRVYKSVAESYTDHSDFLLTRSRYAPLFQLPSTSYKYWALGLKEAGYATNPKYASILIAYIEEYHLNEFDNQAIAMLEQKDKLLNQPQNGEQLLVKVDTKVEANTKHHKQLETTPVNPKTGREEFTVNGLRAVKAAGNEDPLKIAMEFNIDYSYIMAWNDLATGDNFKDGENVFLQAKKSRGTDATAKVNDGETMRDVSQRTGIKLYELYVKNSMRMNDQAYAGETLNLQEKRANAPRTMTYAEYLKTQNRAANSNQTRADNFTLNAQQYQVQQSDTLYSIAQKFNTSVDQLRAWNKLEAEDVKAGQTLVVSK